MLPVLYTTIVPRDTKATYWFQDESTMTHRGQILASINGNPDSLNDETLVFFDNFILNIKQGHMFENHTFQFLDKDGDEIVPFTYKGVWTLCDNGYHNFGLRLQLSTLL
mmetsp:Transcript_22044/g.33935  ORF Transcript_22044/g.33935 Transcript_22044/m.33935 type:complete len:109 (-) Transcript_22044:64-390(-)